MTDPGNATPALFRIAVDGRPRLAAGTVGDGPTRLLAETLTIGEILADPEAPDALAGAAGTALGPAVSSAAAPLAPTDLQEVWASGVTYRRSNEARQEESDTPDVYQRVHEAERPELFLKAPPGLARGDGAAVGIRADSTWDVPEPELALVFDAAGRLVAYTIGNDMSSRSIEGENPLYLPQAKCYDGSLGLGPSLVPVGAAPELAAMEVTMTIRRDGAEVFAGAVALTEMRRTVDEFGAWLYRARTLPHGSIVLTGTGIVPDDDFTAEPGDVVAISITGLGTLHQTIERVGTAA